MAYLETTDGTRLFYTCWGPAYGEAVVFVHGLALGLDMWEYQMLHLADRGFRCIAYDQRGCRRSDQPGHGYDFDTFAADLALLLAQLTAEQVTLVGFSLGGGIIARYLSRYGGERIAQVMLVAPTTPYLLKSDENPEGMDRRLVFDSFTAGLLQDRPQLLAEVADSWFGVGLPGVVVSSAMRQWVIDLCHHTSPWAMHEMFRVGSTTDFRLDMPAFTMPTLVIHGDSDPFAPLEVSGERTAGAIPNSRLEVYENAAHGLFLTHKDRLNLDLLRFLKREFE